MLMMLALSGRVLQAQQMLMMPSRPTDADDACLVGFFGRNKGPTDAD